MAPKLDCESGIYLLRVAQVVLLRCYRCLQLLKSDTTEIAPWHTLSNIDILTALSEKANTTLLETVSAKTHTYMYINKYMLNRKTLGAFLNLVQ